MTPKTEVPMVLIIEDDLDIQSFISRVLELEGYRVLKADNGYTGMELIKANTVSLVLLDLRLPGLDGWSILQDIKGDPDLAHIPVAVLTAIAESVEQRRTLRMGAVKYLVKPLSAQHLSQTVDSILRQKAKRRASVKRTAAAKN